MSVRGSRVERRGGLGRLVAILLLVWLIVGAIAAGQRHYYTSDAGRRCTSVGTIALTVVAGPLNYASVNPKVHCRAPRPDR